MSDSPTTTTSVEKERNPVETIATDYAQSLRCGHRGAIDPIVASNPQHDEELRDLLPVIQRLEQARQRHVQRPGGLASLGVSRPKQLGDYELVRQIGRGGMGVVFEAVQRSLGRRVAVKILPQSLLGDERQLERFHREARTAGSLHHTNIVQVFGVGSDHGFHYYVMERIEGSGLDRVLAERKDRFTPREVAHIGRQAASAIAYAHQHGVLHRDVKPANLIVNDKLDLWVTDFGVSKAIEQDATTTGEIVGTLRYMAPEQIRGKLDPRSDIYSLGCTLYELLAGRPAADDPTVRQSIVASRPVSPAPHLRKLNKAVPRDLETILHSAMAIDIEDRYASAKDLAADLRRFLDDEPIKIEPPSRLRLAWRWAQRNPAVAFLSAATALLLVGMVLMSWGRAQRARVTLLNESRLRTAAEANASIAAGALDDIFRRFMASGDQTSTLSASTSSSPTLSNEAAELLKELIRYYDELAVHGGDGDESFNQSAREARYAIGMIYHQLGQYEQAIKVFEAVGEMEPGHPGGQTTETEKVVREAERLNRIGIAFRMLGDEDRANAVHTAVIGLLTRPNIDATSPDVRFQKAQTHLALAQRIRPGMGPETLPPMPVLAFLQDGPVRPFEPHHFGPGPVAIRGESERRHLSMALGIFRALHESDPSHVGYSLGLAATLGNLRSDSLISATAEELKADREAIEILRELQIQHPANQAVQHELAVSLAQFSVFEPGLNRIHLEWAIDRLEEAAEHCDALTRSHPNVPAYTSSCAHIHFKLGLLLSQYGDRLGRPKDNSARQERVDMKRKAVAAHRTAWRHQAMLSREHPDAVGYKMWNAAFVHSYGQLQRQIGSDDEAERTLTRAARLWQRLAEDHPEHAFPWLALTEAELTLQHVADERSSQRPW